MQRIPAIDPAQTTGKTKQLLDAVQAQLGVIPNLMKTIAASPAALEGYLSLSGALKHGTLGGRFGEQLSLLTAQQNGCEYCLSAHTYLGEHVAKLDAEEMCRNRAGDAENEKTHAGLQFAQQLIARRGKVTAEEFEAVRAAGYTDGQISEIIGHVALNILTNYFNNAVQTEIDFPKVSA